MTTLRYKTAGHAAVDIDDRGRATVQAVIATLDEVDLDGDTYEPGAFAGAEGVIISAWNHNAVVAPSLPPVGIGRVDEIGNKAVFTGEIWAESGTGLDTYRMLKARGAQQQWSYGFYEIKVRETSTAGRRVRVLQRLEVYEVSPVRRGAGGPGAHTLEVVDAKALDDVAHEYARFVHSTLLADVRRERQLILEGIR